MQISKTVVFLLFLLVSASRLTAADSTDSGFWAHLLDRPLYGSIEQTQMVNSASFITKVLVGPDGELWIGRHNSMEYGYAKNNNRTQFLTLTAGYKQYGDDRSASFPFIDFLGLSSWISAEISGGWTVNAMASVLEKNTDFFSNNYYKWMDVGFGGGYDFFDQEDRKLALTGNVGLGLDTYRIDTLIFQNIPQKDKGSVYNWGQVNFAMSSSYKAFAANASAHCAMGSSGSGRTYQYRYRANVSYTLWQKRTEGDMFNKEVKIWQNNFKVFAEFEQDGLSINKIPQDKPEEEIYFDHVSSVRVGVSGRLGRFW